MKRYRVVVKGIVQGVGYRYFAVQQARRYNIKGWVKNKIDGSVEVVCEGEEDNINEFIKELKRGPFSADVQALSIEEEKYKGEFQDFEVRF